MAASKGKITIRDIARAAKVSVATVSRAFDERYAARVDPRTRERIIDVAKQNGYRPHPTARALSRGSTETMALIVPAGSHFSGSEYYSRVTLCAVETLQNAGYDLKVHALRPGDMPVNLDDLRGRLAVDGILVAGISDARRFTSESESPSVPIVFLNSSARGPFDSVDADNFEGGRMAAQFLINHGHRALGMLCGPRDSRNAFDRETGFRQMGAQAGVALREEWFVECEFTVENGREACRGLFTRKKSPTAVFCANDEIALGALRALAELNLRCPQDVSLIGFDNISAAEHTSPPLTTIEQPIETMVTTAVDKLLALTKQPAPAAGIVFQVRLVERKSVARVAVRTAARAKSRKKKK